MLIVFFVFANPAIYCFCFFFKGWPNEPITLIMNSVKHVIMSFCFSMVHCVDDEDDDNNEENMMMIMCVCVC